MMKQGRCFAGFLAVCLCTFVAAPAHAFDDATADRVLLFARQQLTRTTTEITSTTRSPTATLNSTSGPWKLEESDDLIGWTQGFYPGLLWFMYEQSGRDPFWRSKAEPWTTALEVQLRTTNVNLQTHDLGFKFMTSYGNAYRVTGNDTFRQTAVTAANLLSQRFRPPGIIDCCDWTETPRWRNSMVTDTMMDLELLFWAARNGGSDILRQRALTHALRTMTDMVRDDGGTIHVIDYEENTGRFLGNRTYQGFSATSTWARGQAWAIYGFTMAYRYTRDARMLETAQKTANYYLDRLPADFIPNWDFDPDAPRRKDSSAAAIVASALLELSTFVTDPAVAQRYRNAALATLDTLSSSAYLAQGTASPGILLHGVGFHPNDQKREGSDVDRSLIYADYYFIEAVLRFKRQSPGGWFATLGFSESVHTLGTGNTGVVDVDFDVTPFSNSVDGVIGYADSSTTITGYGDLAMTVRLNPDGFFDVRRGGAFAALVSLPYVANNTYHVRMRADLIAKVYSVWVTPPGGSEVLLADRFAFRTGAPPIDDLGKVSLRTVRFDYDFRVNNHRPGPDEPPPPPPPWLSTTDFSRSVRDLGAGNTGIREVVFNVMPVRRPVDSVIGYADSSTTVTGYGDLAMTIRLNPAGFFDVRNGGGFAARVSLPYAANTTYRVRMRTDLNAKVYSVWVTPPGGSEVLLAERFVFRTGAPPTDDLGQVAIRSIGFDGDIQVTGHTVRAVTSLAYEDVRDPGAPTPETPEVLGVAVSEEESLRGCAAAPGSALAVAGVLLALLGVGWRRRRQ